MFLIFLKIPQYSVIYKNPFWIKESKIIKIKVVKLNSIEINSNISYDFINGIRNGFFYELKTNLNLSNYIFLNTGLRLGENIPFLKSFIIKGEFHPLSFLLISLSYRLKTFFEEKILENNIVFFIKEIIFFSKFYKIEFIQGLNLKFIDLNTIDYGIEYRKDFLFHYFFIWGIKIVFNPLFFYSFGIDVSNFSDFEIFSQNYWQFEIINYFHLPYKISLYLNGGCGFSGSFPFAANINRFWIKFGVLYEIKI